MCLRCSRGGEIDEDDVAEVGWLGALSDWTFARIPADISFEGGRLEITRWEFGLALRASGSLSPSALSQPLSKAQTSPLF